MKKLIFFGIGPKMAIVLLPWLAGTSIVNLIFFGEEYLRYKKRETPEFFPLSFKKK